MLHRIPCDYLSRFRKFIPIKKKTMSQKKKRERDFIYLSCTLNSSSMSSSSQLSSQSLFPPDFAAPGGAPPRCARSVCESSQSVPCHYKKNVIYRKTREIVAPSKKKTLS